MTRNRIAVAESQLWQNVVGLTRKHENRKMTHFFEEKVCKMMEIHENSMTFSFSRFYSRNILPGRIFLPGRSVPTKPWRWLSTFNFQFPPMKYFANVWLWTRVNWSMDILSLLDPTWTGKNRKQEASKKHENHEAGKSKKKSYHEVKHEKPM